MGTKKESTSKARNTSQVITCKPPPHLAERTKEECEQIKAMLKIWHEEDEALKKSLWGWDTKTKSICAWETDEE